ncbi:hypothetical protein CPB83DRAFT_855148 [Crepidotus variabilis]|uniref:Uncharacterized protein n=1 Tax=Crepidotus variabilis TaxID=179855 RepID=A0A9P6EF78_9AGAR|nr:hypothetical protein CPB83DRAFT_855148 [Crepidotus variabilis]
MALNWVMLNANRAPVPLPNEMNITTVEGVEVVVIIPDAPPAGSSSSGGSGGIKKLKGFGKTFLTDQRFIFTSPDSTSATFESLSAPLHAILSTRFEQPTFGANYLSFEVKPSPEGGLTEGTKVEVRFKDRAMFEFVSLLEKARERSIYMKRLPEEDDENLPSYSTPAESSSVSMVGGIPVENPPGYD